MVDSLILHACNFEMTVKWLLCHIKKIYFDIIVVSNFKLHFMKILNWQL